MLDVIIKGGTVVAPEGAAVMDVGIQGEQIVAVSASGTLDAVRGWSTDRHRYPHLPWLDRR